MKPTSYLKLVFSTQIVDICLRISKNLNYLIAQELNENINSIQYFVIEIYQIIEEMTLRSKDVNIAEPQQDQPHNRIDHNHKFYEEFKKIFTTGFCLSQQLRQLVENKEELWKKLLVFEKKAEEEFKDKIRPQAPEKKKRNRRTADEIQKSFTCSVQRCQRAYGSQGSLIQHIKLKHPTLYEEMARSGQLKHSHSESNQHDSQ